jgi:solute carrier family 15 (peptide/histidine transporter), member 3/4
MLYYCMQPCISVHLVKVVSVLVCHPSEQTSLTMKILASPASSPVSLTGTPPLVERKRKQTATQMSLFWLTPQFFLLGVSDVTSFPGLLEFLNSEAPRGMKSIATALFWCEIGLSPVLATFLVQVVNKATRHGHRGGWLEGTSLNNSRLDSFYWVVTVVGLLAFVNYLYWAKRYNYRQDPRIVEESGSQ